MKEEKVRNMLKIYERTLRKIWECEQNNKLHGLQDQAKEDIEDYLVMLLKESK